MPRDTFFNLTEKKRKKIIDAALTEFAENDYDKASISRIVRATGIAKGSFYQYFDDKMDLFKHILHIGKDLKMAFIGQRITGMDTGGFLETYRIMFKLGIQFAEEHPRHALIGQRLLKNREMVKMIVKDFEDDRDKILGSMIRAGISSGELREDIDVKLLSDLLTNMMVFVFDNYGTEVKLGQFASMLPHVDRIMDIIARGIVKR